MPQYTGASGGDDAYGATEMVATGNFEKGNSLGKHPGLGIKGSVNNGLTKCLVLLA
jgi:hypothetical protein